MSDFSDPLERWQYGSALAGLIGGAWVALGLLSASLYSPYFSHAIAEGTGRTTLAARAALFVAGWEIFFPASRDLPCLPEVPCLWLVLGSGTVGLAVKLLL